MKKYLKLFFLMLLVFSYSYSGVISKTDWSDKGLKGKVKTIVKTEYEYDSSGKLENIWKTITDFNKKGYIIKESTFVNDGEREVITYKYDKDGLITEKVVKNFEDYARYKYKSEYTKDGNLVMVIELSEKVGGLHSQYEKVTYDKTGKVINAIAYVNGKLILDFTYIYNKKGQLIKAKNNKEPNYSEIITYNYQKDGKYEKITNGLGRIVKIYYDKNGDEKEFIDILAFDSIPPVFHLEQYIKYKNITKDKYGNVTTIDSVLYSILKNNKINVEDIYQQIQQQKIKEIGIISKIKITYEYYN
ncbi:hypothetical protein [Fusobacterium nucleatum]|uniref:hypothetical protein n=1 Tax=Fusobacterium nucleatum TaxID=851 RepID=UPI0004092A39|nr:hypothetical protein [Fusobacterium nucleatum]ALF23438.1 hypothetical protein RO05_03235 [Fusobacterium nucleatum subsp. nucleatum ChDC F316]ASG27177.1 hypothetical protein RN84_10660 [Fusobacterium nucleatum subsp. nucleatum]